MKITFCGHSQFNSTKKVENDLLSIFSKLPKNEPIEFYIGGYGSFDSFSLNVCKKYKESNTSAKIYFVTPYLNPSYLTSKSYYVENCDEVISFEFSSKSRRYSIIKRNFEMIKLADLLIAYVEFPFGGAYKSLSYAKKIKKTVINLFEHDKTP